VCPGPRSWGKVSTRDENRQMLVHEAGQTKKKNHKKKAPPKKETKKKKKKKGNEKCRLSNFNFKNLFVEVYRI